MKCVYLMCKIMNNKNAPAILINTIWAIFSCQKAVKSTILETINTL